MNELENWRAGEPLSFAVFEFAEHRQRAQFRESTDLGRSHVLKDLMYADLFGHLASGALAAFGFCLSPQVSDGPVLIPRHCFDLRPKLNECDDDVISASGWHYERVRILKFALQNSDELPSNPPVSAQKPGRPSTYPAARATLLELNSLDPSYVRNSANRLLDQFNKAYLHHAHKYGFAPIDLSERVLRDHLKRFRQELAEIGNNKSAF